MSMKERIQKAQNKLNCNQHELATIMGVTTSAFSRWKNDKADPRSEKMTLFEVLEQRIKTAPEPEQLKKKLLIVSHLSNQYSPVELLEQNRIEETIKEGIEEFHILEDQFLQQGLTFFNLTRRRIDYWLELVRTGEVEIDNLEAWQEVLRYVPYIEKYIASLLWDPFVALPEQYEATLGKTLAHYLRHQTIIPDEKFQEKYDSSWPAKGVKGYLDATNRAAEVLLEYLNETPDEELEKQWEGAEDLWKNYIWPGEESLREALEYIVETVQEGLIEEIHFPEHWEEFGDENS